MIAYRIALSNDLMPVNKLLHAIDKTFPIALSKKTDISELAKKIIEKGYAYLAVDDGLPVGIVGFYANNLQTRTAYISVVGVIHTHQRKGIARELVSRTLLICKEKGMSSCVLYTHKTNVGAIAMYEKFGFIAEEDPNRPLDIKFIKTL